MYNGNVVHVYRLCPNTRPTPSQVWMWNAFTQAGPLSTYPMHLARLSRIAECPGPADPDAEQWDEFLDELLTGLSSGDPCRLNFY